MRKKNVVILGSTGSIGINTLKVIDRFPQAFNVIGLTAYSNYRLLEKQIQEFAPRYVAVNDAGCAYLKNTCVGRGLKILNAHTDLEAITSLKEVDLVVIAMQGSAALKPFLAAVRCGKTVAPANKEAIVIAGDILMEEARRHKARIVPIDSEQSAIFQCLDGRDAGALHKVYLTASGGALLNVPRARFNKMSVRQILDHPRWKMGKRITVDSATLMNKGFEVIEAKHLFGLDVKDIEVLVHPEAIIHSMVEFRDGSIMAQLGVTDMRLPIQYALTYPQRLETGLKRVDFHQIGQLTFLKPDLKKFPCLALAVQAARQAGTMPGVLNAADEVAVEAFLKGHLSFIGIEDVVHKVIGRHRIVRKPSIVEILEADRWAREEARGIISWKR